MEVKVLTKEQAGQRKREAKAEFLDTLDAQAAMAWRREADAHARAVAIEQQRDALKGMAQKWWG